MPELPEVETLKRKLLTVLPGKKIVAIQLLHPKPWSGEVASVTVPQLKITDVTRRAKILRIHLGEEFSLLVHLKMTGQLIYSDGHQRLGGGHPTADWVQQLPSSHTRLVFEFADGSSLFFNDQRLFGWVRLVPRAELTSHYQNLGPDIIEPEVTSTYLSKIFQRRRQPIKQVIMDNAVIAGVGNIYACEALHWAQIAPQRPANSLTQAETERLLSTMQQVITRGIELGGTTTDGKYVDVHGFAGGYQHELRVYDREGQPCPVCGTEIAKLALGGRGTYWCPTCQR